MEIKIIESPKIQMKCIGKSLMELGYTTCSKDHVRRSKALEEETISILTNGEPRLVNGKRRHFFLGTLEIERLDKQGRINLLMLKYFGRCNTEYAKKLVNELKEKIGIPIHLFLESEEVRYELSRSEEFAAFI